MAVLFVTHDMAVVAQMADRVVVMHRGKIIEEGGVTTIFENPQADYTRMLLAAVPNSAKCVARLRRRRCEDLAIPPSRAPAFIVAAGTTPFAGVKNLTTRYPVRGALCAASSPTSTQSRT